MGRLDAAGKLADVRRLTHNERFNSPFAWTPDSQSIIFNSDSSGGTSAYRQGIQNGVSELIATGTDRPVLDRISPDGAALLYETPSHNYSAGYRLMRVSLTGRPPELVLEEKNSGFNFDCPHRAGARCIESERSSDGRQETFYSLDPSTGSRYLLFHLAFPADRSEFVNWTMSSDGSRLAMTGADPKGRIEVRSLTGAMESVISVDRWADPSDIDWAADGRSVFISHPGLIDSPSGPIGATILRVALDGRVQPLWDTRGGRITWAIASPDGKYLAIREPATERNAWMIENF